ncbi:50S ribosomal protein L23 [Candidatus Berkelbacteria bacterium RBG_13_40_8]|uniref:Large ribosomal subunit protein uL23 n=1 Tax=Candidatus Berkelbacteria bacterium RBG_13_40_8 TaxID=1797467 RepID=A0A1F5DLW7_9BACT|nr:MAG: 50S ribosomal protein L23 [Candidatus Berkelbacteria bacterium RBG_13_40_8]
MRAILKPIITEKSMQDSAKGKYVFRVDFKANKHQIAEGIKKLHKVEVLKVNIIKVGSEEKTVRGRYKIKTQPWKKAIITLKKGQKIEGFEVKE